MIDLKDYLFGFHHIKIPVMGDYYPNSKRRIESFDNFSTMIRELKKNDEFAVDYFFNRLKGYLSDPINIIVVVPSHDPESDESGIKSLALRLAKFRGWNDSSDLIKRKHFIEKLSTGGDRRIKIHRESLIGTVVDNIKEKKILLIDDVTTTGNSIYACMEILENLGARYIQPFALAQTYHVKS